MMVRTLFLLAILLLLISGCSEELSFGPMVRYCSLNPNGSNFMENDYSLMGYNWGKPYYISDDLIFNVSHKLVKRDINNQAVIQIIPDSLSITDTDNLAFNHDEQLLYFAANNAIYRLGFAGNNLTRLSPNDGGSYSAPVLSSCRSYLTAVRDKRIVKLDLAEGVWQGPLSPVNVKYAHYLSDTDEYYYFSHFSEANIKKIGLIRYSETSLDSTLLMSTVINNNGTVFSWNVSENSRFYAMKQDVDTDYGPVPSTLLIYDRQLSDYFEITNCFTYSFSSDGNSMLYSRQMHGMADLMMMNLETRQSAVIWDGFFSRSRYSENIEEIHWRRDGQVIHFKCWQTKRDTDRARKSQIGKITGLGSDKP